MRTLLAGCIIVLLAGCCKVYCDGRELGISFRTFKAADTDTVVFVSYLPKTTTKVDSFAIVSIISANDTTRSSVSHAISSAYDWKITLSSINREFAIENFQLKKDQCSCGGSEYQLISSFTVNGVRKNGLSVDLE